MNVIEVLPIFRGKFSQNTKHFFTKEDFLVGNIIEIPFSRTTTKAIILKIKNLKEIKQQIRKESLDIKKLEKTPEVELIKEDDLEKIHQVAQKKSWHISDVLNKILGSKNIKKISAKDFSLDKKEVEDMKILLRNFDLSKIDSKKNKKEKEKRVGGLSGIKYDMRISGYKAPTEKHLLVNEIRGYFGEKAVRGFGSFSHYIGFFQKIPNSIIYQILAEVKYSRKSTEIQKKIFWKKIGEYFRKQDKK